MKWLKGHLAAGMRWLIIDGARDQFGCRQVAGPWWTIHLVSGNDETETAIREDLVRAPPASIARLARADFAVDKHPGPGIEILQVPSRIGMRSFLTKIGWDRRRDPPIDDSDGLYLSAGRLGVVAGDPGSAEFRHTLIHELAHGYCHFAVGAQPKIVWATEGYIELLVGRVFALAGNPTPPNLRRHLEDVSNLINTGQLRPSVELMRLGSDSEPALEYPAYGPHSAMLMLMLVTEGQENTELLDVCRRAVRGRGVSPDRIVHLLEECTATQMSEIHVRFVEFCRALIRDARAQPRIESPYTMFGRVAGIK